jgi:hypothetical protein
MTRSIFDPGNPNVERSGDRYTGPDARSNSNMPPDVIDGKVEGADAGPDTVAFDANGEPLAATGNAEKANSPEAPSTKKAGELVDPQRGA